MNIDELLDGWTNPSSEEEISVDTYSATGDILSYRRCRRQYGTFNVRGFSSASSTQRYFGTLVHDVLDSIHRDYLHENLLPGRDELEEEYILPASERLSRTGIKSYNMKQQRRRATKLIWRFITVLGESFFDHIQDAEYRLERSLETGNENIEYTLQGVVDVVAGAVGHALGLPTPTEPDDIEIWDYKAGEVPDADSDVIQDYEFQMHVYAELFKRQTGTYPARCALAFLGELDDDETWKNGSAEPHEFQHLIYTIPPHPDRIEEAQQYFHETVEEINRETQKPFEERWKAPVENPPDEQTCRACELRYNCSAYPEGGSERQQPL